jgi:hypothetical protein
MKYSTFEGKVVDTEEIGHQHISNIYWYQTIYMGGVNPVITDRINNEFNGEILSYRPHPKFKAEIDYLEHRGLLSWKEVDGIRKADIIWGDQVVGEAFYLEDQRDILIKKLIS